VCSSDLGALGAGVGAGLTCVSAGASFGAGFTGSAGFMSAVSIIAPGGALWGAAISGASIGASSFITGAGNAWMGGAKFGKGLERGLISGVKNGLMAGVTGGILGGLNAVGNGRDFWRGSGRDTWWRDNVQVHNLETTPEYLPTSSQPTNSDCIFGTAASLDPSLGGADDIKFKYFQSGRTYNEKGGIDDVPFWEWFSEETGHELRYGTYTPSEMGNWYGNPKKAPFKAAISLQKGHSVGLNSVIKQTVFKPNGKEIINYFYKVMDPMWNYPIKINPSQVVQFFLLY
jgi:hypothetical protein